MEGRGLRRGWLRLGVWPALPSRAPLCPLNPPRDSRGLLTRAVCLGGAGTPELGASCRADPWDRRWSAFGCRRLGSARGGWGPTDVRWGGPTDVRWGPTNASWVQPTSIGVQPVHWGPTDVRWGSADVHWGQTEVRWGPTDVRWGPADVRWGGPTDVRWGPTDASWVQPTSVGFQPVR